MKVAGHVFGHERLRRDRGVRRTSADREVVSHHDNGLSFDFTTAENAIRGRNRFQVAIGLIFAYAGNRPDFMKAVRINQSGDPFANGQPSCIMLPFNLIGSAHLASKRFAPRKFIELRLPVHVRSPLCTLTTGSA